MAINNNGEVVGYYDECVIGPSRPYYWSEATGLVLPELPAGYFSARFYDINDSAQITGIRTTGFTGLGNEAIRYENGRWTGLNVLPGDNWSEGLAISNDGTIVGFSLNNFTGPSHACRWDGLALTNLGPTIGGVDSEALGISEDGVIVGYVDSGAPNSKTGFILDGSTVLTVIPPLPGRWNSVVVGMNSAGSAIVNAWPVPGPPSALAFLMNDDTWQPIPPTEPYGVVRAHGVNAKGLVVGEATDLCCGGDAIVFTNGKSRRLRELILPPLEIYIARATAINDAGWIVADAAFDIFTFVTLVLRPLISPPGDIDADCTVGPADLAILLGSWGDAAGAADLDADGDVDAQDLSVLLGNWGSLLPP